jgi:flavorubredoxin
MVHGEMLCEGLRFSGAAFGVFGWSGEAQDRIFETMKNVYKMDMVSSSLSLKSNSPGCGIKMEQDYGRELAKKPGL